MTIIIMSILIIERLDEQRAVWLNSIFFLRGQFAFGSLCPCTCFWTFSAYLSANTSSCSAYISANLDTVKQNVKASPEPRTACSSFAVYEINKVVDGGHPCFRPLRADAGFATFPPEEATTMMSLCSQHSSRIRTGGMLMLDMCDSRP